MRTYGATINDITRSSIINITFANGKHPTCAIMWRDNQYRIYNYYWDKDILYRASMIKELKRILYEDVLNGFITKIQIIEKRSH